MPWTTIARISLSSLFVQVVACTPQAPLCHYDQYGLMTETAYSSLTSRSLTASATTDTPEADLASCIRVALRVRLKPYDAGTSWSFSSCFTVAAVGWTSRRRFPRRGEALSIVTAAALPVTLTLLLEDRDGVSTAVLEAVLILVLPFGEASAESSISNLTAIRWTLRGVVVEAGRSAENMTAWHHPPIGPHFSARKSWTSSYSCLDMGLFFSREGKEGCLAAMAETCVSIGISDG